MTEQAFLWSVLALGALIALGAVVSAVALTFVALALYARDDPPSDNR